MYFDKIFKEWTKDTDVLARKYPYSLSNMTKRIAKNKDFASIKETIEDVTLDDACKMKVEGLTADQNGTGLLAGFIPDIFTDTIVQFGNRVGIARRDFPVVSQSSNSSFKHRYMWRHDSAQIVREGDDILHSITKREVDEFSFVKIADSMMYTRELLEDSPISQVSLDTAMAANKLSMLVDRLMWHELTWVSSENVNVFEETTANPWTDHNLVTFTCDSGTAVTSTTIKDSVSSALLNLTTRLEDSVPFESLRLYISPTWYRTLWNDDTYRRYDILGAQPKEVTGTVPPLYRIPTTIITPGYFDEDSNWVYEPNDAYLVATGTAAIRQRADMRMEPLVIQQRQMEGWQMSERIRPYVINPISFIRITCSPTVPIKSIEGISYKPRDLSKEGTEEMITINV